MTRHAYSCHVRFSDVDVYGHVNNVKYFEYYQEARLAALADLPRDADGRGLSIVVARIVVDYRRPMLFRPEPYVVSTAVARVGGSSFDLDCAIRDPASPEGAPLSTALATVVRFDLAAQTAHRLDAADRALLESMTAG